jgi:hypothetical protein
MLEQISSPLTVVVQIIAALGAGVWLASDSFRRHLPAARWRPGVFLPLLILIPALALALIGGQEIAAGGAALAGLLITLGITAAYALRFRGLRGCVNGHPPYPASKKSCPVCARTTIPGLPGLKIDSDRLSDQSPAAAPVSTPARPRQQAWIKTESGFAYQLFADDTTLGRDEKNDIRLVEPSVSRAHARIAITGGSFTLVDLGSSGGTWLNGTRIHHPETLKHNDVIRLGANTTLTFVTQMHTGAEETPQG